MAFGEADAVFICHQGAVVEGWGRELEGFIKKELARGGEKEIRAANHFGDLHGGIVESAGELVGGEIIMTPDEEITEVVSRDAFLGAEMAIVEFDGFSLGHAEAPTDTSARINILEALFAAGARVEGLLFALVRGGEGANDILAGTGAWEDDAR